MLATSTQLEVLDLRHFSAPALRSLLEDEGKRWEQRLAWDYSRSTDLLLEYVNNRALTGYVALLRGRVTGYGFGVCEASKAVLGDVYAFGETETESNPVCEVLLGHLLETFQATPGIHRVESQLLLFSEHALAGPFLREGFRAFPRFYMVRSFHGQPGPATPLRDHFRIERWHPDAYVPAAQLIQEAYVGHTDADINDQYRTVLGAQRFLHNIVHFPGCGVFDPENSWLLCQASTGLLEGILLCSRVRGDSAHITQLCVRASLRGQGLGDTLLTHCLHELHRSGLRVVSLTVTAGNVEALKLYHREGFEIHHRFAAWVWGR